MKKTFQLFLLSLALTFKSLISMAAVVYTDIDPDTTIHADITTVVASYYLDINNDNISDFEIRHFFPDSVNAAIEFCPLNGNEVIVSNNGYIKAMDVSSLINNAVNWESNPFPNYLNNEAGNGGNWVGVIDKFLGLRIKISGQWHYGWCKVDVPTNASYFVVKGYAYEDTPNNAINAGDTGTSSSVLDNELEKISIHPNPVKDYIIIKNTINSKIESIELFDLSGKLEKIYSVDNIKIDVSDFKKGIHILKIVTVDGIFTKKIIIE